MWAILSETQSRPLNVHLAELALLRRGARPFPCRSCPPRARRPTCRCAPPGASAAIQGHAGALAALCSVGAVIDLTVEGLMHAAETPQILKSGARIINISNEHPEALERLLPDEALKERNQRGPQAPEGRKRDAGDLEGRNRTCASVLDARDRCRRCSAIPTVPARCRIFPAASYWPSRRKRASTVAWCSTAATSTSPSSATSKARSASPIEDDYISAIDGSGTDAELTRRYFAAWGDRNAYATSHVGYGLNEARALRGAGHVRSCATPTAPSLRAFAGNFSLFDRPPTNSPAATRSAISTSPSPDAPSTLDGVEVVRDGELLAEAG